MRKIIIPLLTALLLAGSIWAEPRFTTDPAGNLYRFWLEDNNLKLSKSIDQGITFGPAVNVYTFTQEVKSFDLKIGKNFDYFITLETSREIYFISSSFGVKTVKISTEAISFPSIAVDDFNQVHVIYLSRDPNRARVRLNYGRGTSVQSLEATLEAQTIFETPDEIVNPRLAFSPWGPLISWQKVYQNRRETGLILSLDQGKNLGSIKILPEKVESSDLLFLGGKWFTLKERSTKEVTLKEVKLEPPPAPEVIPSQQELVTNSSSPEITYRLAGNDLLICKIDISGDINFPVEKTWSFEHLSTREAALVSYRLPIELPDGNYFLQLSAFDGLSTSFPTEVMKLKIDRTPPTITLTSPTTEVVEQREILLVGMVSEAAELWLNDLLVTAEASGEFNAPLTLTPGSNFLRITATDEAGNSTTFTKNILYHTQRPEIKVLKPKETDWFKPDSAIFIEAEVWDLQGDLEDEAEGELIISGRSLPLFYEKDSGRLSGFINLPEELSDGKNPAKIRLRDLAGNVGESNFKINIDRMAPIITLSAGEVVFSNSASGFSLPVMETGAGMDPSATLVKIAGVPLEGFAKIESPKVPGETPKLIVKAKFPLPDGTYEGEVVPRDLIGNTGKLSAFKLIVDTAAPKLIIFSSFESENQEKLRIEGEAEDDFLSAVEIYNNQKKLESFYPPAKVFVREILLFPGRNEIEVTAVDRAGNRTTQTVSTFSSVKAAAVLTDYGNGPNPFSPKTDGQMQFVYKLSQAADLKIYIFDLSGSLIWEKELAGATSGTVSWNGIDHFGSPVNSGVYPYLIQASAAGVTEIKRGRIIVYQ